MKRNHFGRAALALLILASLWMASPSRVSIAAIGPGGENLGSGQLGPTTGPEAEGRKLWLRLNCSGCHGSHDEGGMAPSIRRAAYDVGSAVTEGREAGMPSFKGLVTQTDINNLTAYLLSLDGANPPVFTQWWGSPPQY